MTSKGGPAENNKSIRVPPPETTKRVGSTIQYLHDHPFLSYDNPGKYKKYLSDVQSTFKAYGKTFNPERSAIWSQKWALLPSTQRFTDPDWIGYVDSSLQYLYGNPDFKQQNPEQYKTFVTDIKATYEAYGEKFDDTMLGAYSAPASSGAFYSANQPTTPNEPVLGIPEGYKGGKTGPRGEPLPAGASAYNALGEPVYTPVVDPSKLTPEMKKALVKSGVGIMARLSSPDAAGFSQAFDAGWNLLTPGLQQFLVDVTNDIIGVTNKAGSEFVSPAEGEKPDKMQGLKDLGAPAEAARQDLLAGKFELTTWTSLAGMSFKAGTDWLAGTLDEIAPPWADSIADTLRATGDVAMFGLSKPAEYTERLIGYEQEKAKRGEMSIVSLAPPFWGNLIGVPLRSEFQKKYPVLYGTIYKFNVDMARKFGGGVTEDVFTPMSDLEMYEISKMGWTTDPLITIIQESASQVFPALTANSDALRQSVEEKIKGKLRDDNVTEEDVSLSYGWTQYSSHIEMSLAQNQMRRDDFLARIRSGDNPTDVAMQLSNPARELLGQIVIDPTNFIGDIMGPVLRSMRWSEALKATNAFEAVRIEQGMEAANAARKAQNAIRIGKETVADVKLIDSIASASRTAIEVSTAAKQSGEIVVFGKRIGGVAGRIIVPMARMNVSKSLNSMQITFSSLFAEANKLEKFKNAPKEIADFIVSKCGALAVVAKGPGLDAVSKVNYEAALKILSKSDASAFLLSKTGMETGKVLGQVFFDSAGKWDKAGAERLAKIFMESGNDVSKATEKLFPEVEKFFPSLSKRMAFENEAEALMKGGTAFEDLPKHLQQWSATPVGKFTRSMEKVLGKGEGMMNKWMPLMSRIYIRKNPAVMVRNLIQNELQIMIDYGLRANFASPEKGMEWLQGFMVQSRGSMKGFSSGLGGLAGDIERITGVKQGGNWMEKFSKASMYEKTEMWGKAQVAITSAKNSIDTLSYMRIADDMTLHSMGLPDDLIKSMNHSAVQGFSYKKVVDALRNGDVVRSLDSLLTKDETAQLRKFGLYDSLNDYLVKGDVSDEAKLAVLKPFREAAEQGKATPRLLDAEDDLDSLSKEIRSYFEEDAANGRVIDDLMERSNTQYHVAEVEMTSAFDDSVEAARQKLYNSDRTLTNRKIFSDFGKKSKSIKDGREISKQKVIRDLQQLRNDIFRDHKYPEASYAVMSKEIITNSHLDQLRKYEDGVAELQKILDPSGIKFTEFNPDKWTKAEDDFGTLLAMDDLDNEWFTLSGNKVNIEGSGGNPILNIFARYRIPMARQDKFGNVVPYGWKQIQSLMESVMGKEFNLTWDQIAQAKKLVANGTITPEMLAEIENKMAAQTFRFRPDKGLTYTEWMYQVDGAAKSSEYAKEWESISEKMKSAVTQEETFALTNRKNQIISELQKGIADKGKSINTAIGDAVNAGNHVAAADQEDHIVKMLEDIFSKTDDDIGKVRPKLELDDDGWKKLYKWAEDGDDKLAEARPTIMAKMDMDIEHTLLDYDNKRGFDRLLSFIFPYHFWYSRTYANWLKRIPQNYAIISSYAKWRRQMEVLHAGLPKWWKYQLNTNEIFGLDSKNPLIFNLEATLNPLNGLTGQDFTDETRRTGWFTSMVDDLGKYGPSVHTPYLLAIAAYYALRGESDIAESWAGRLVPQTGPIKSLSSILGFDPQGKGGLELDPSVWVFSNGIEKYERGRATKMLGDMERRGEITHAEAMEAGYKQKGDIWRSAVMKANQERALGNLMGGVLGVGLKGRSQGEIMIEEFNTEMNALYTRLPNLDPNERQKAWNSLFQKYPYGSTILMSRKNGLARDEAFSYDVLRRIPPGQIDDVCKAIGVDYDIINSFYENGLLGMPETDRMRFMAAILDIGSLAEMPPIALRQEWDDARERYSALMAVVPEETMALVNDYYKIKDTNIVLSEKFLRNHPEVSKYMEDKARSIMSDPMLQEYYGGIDFVEGYYRRIAMGAAEANWPGIGEIIAADNEIRSAGGDYKGFEEKYPEIALFRKWMRNQEVQIDAALERLSGKLPEKPEMVWRKDAKAESIMSYELLKKMDADNPSNLSSALAQPYMESRDEDPALFNPDITEFINIQAELRWPGITKLVDQYNKLKSEDTRKASAFAYQYPEIRSYQEFASEIRKKYNDSKKANREDIPSDWETWSTILEGNVQRLLIDYFNGNEMTPALRRNLYRTWQAAGEPMGSFDVWISTLRASYTGTAPIQ